MARLNDPPQPSGETVEGLKRRFIRQNRELARVNSTQSVRIRTLETEVSRLLAENVAIREQVIKLHHEVENRPLDVAWEKVEDLKSKLEDRLLEFGGILRELGAVRKNAPAASVQRKASSTQNFSEKPFGQKLWKAPTDLADSSWEAEGRLPPILEEKLFPRRTLDATAIRALVKDDDLFAESPDPGPPPETHFDEGDNIVISREVKESQLDAEENQSAKSHSLVEARKKRRESQHQITYANENVDIQKRGSETPADAQSRTSKTTAGRRNVPHNPDDQGLASSQRQDAKYDRKRKISDNPRSTGVTKRTENAASAGPKGPSTATTSASVDSKSRAMAAGRKALAPKSANLDPQSPVKRADGRLKDEKLAPKTAAVRFASQRTQHKDEVETVSTRTNHSDNNQDSRREPRIVPAPKTPVLDDLDLFSPTISDPSEPRPERGDTPPPPDLGGEQGAGSFGRASRRSRGSISYAEPNLRDKMRRPTKELIDAVTAIDKARLAHARRQADISSLSTELASMEIKQEESEDTLPKWATKPIFESRSQQERQKATSSSPLSKKQQTATNDLPPSVATDRRRRASSVSRRDEYDHPEPDSQAGAAITTLSQSTRREPRGVNEPAAAKGIDMISQDPELSERTSIFDFTGSSPEHIQDKGKVESLAKPTRMSRRHSSVPAAGDQGEKERMLTKAEPPAVVGGNANGERPSLRSSKSTMGLDRSDAGSLGRAASRRRSMMI